MTEVRIEGAAKLHRVYADLKELGDGKLRRELTKAIREATKPAKDAVKASALAKLPKRGGFAALVANSRVTNVVKTGSQSAGVQIKAVNPGDNIRATDAGNVRHPVFGNRTAWKDQKVPAGWFSEPIAAEAPKVQAAVLKALDDMARKIQS